MVSHLPWHGFSMMKSTINDDELLVVFLVHLQKVIHRPFQEIHHMFDLVMICAISEVVNRTENIHLAGIMHDDYLFSAQLVERSLLYAESRICGAHHEVIFGIDEFEGIVIDVIVDHYLIRSEFFLVTDKRLHPITKFNEFFCRGEDDSRIDDGFIPDDSPYFPFHILFEMIEDKPLIEEDPLSQGDDAKAVLIGCKYLGDIPLEYHVS